MTCKNCNNQLLSTDKFCSQCSAKIITQRLSVPYLLANLAKNVFGWDNKYFVTLKYMLLKPQVLLTEFIGGTRKRYVNPFAFMLIGLTLTIFAYNIFAERYLEASLQSNNGLSTVFEGATDKKIYDEAAVLKQQQTFLTIQTFVLKHMNVLTFLLLPFYSLLSFILYRKQYNYGEHLVINLYIQGVTFIGNLIFFILTITIDPIFLSFNLVISIWYYAYVLGKLHSLSFWQSVLKTTLFLGLFVCLFIGVIILGFIGAMLGVFGN